MGSTNFLHASDLALSPTGNLLIAGTSVIASGLGSYDMLLIEMDLLNGSILSFSLYGDSADQLLSRIIAKNGYFYALG